MPIYKVYAGFRIDDITCARIHAQGLSPETFTEPVAVTKVMKTETETLFIIEADSQSIARAWKVALFNEIGSVEAFEPPTVTDQDGAPPPLDVWARTGIWTKSIASMTTTISSLPSAPKGVIVWGSGLSAAVLATITSNGGLVFGYSNGTDNRDLAFCTQHNQTTSNTNRSISDKAFHLLDPTGTAATHHTETCTISFGATSFDMNWSDDVIASIGHYFVFGGDDIGTVAIKDFIVNTTTSGVVDYTGLGDMFDFGLMLYPFVAGGLPWPTTTVSGTAGALHSISVHGGPNPDRSWTACIRNEDNVNPSSASRLQRRLYMLSGMSETSATEQQYCKFKGWTTDGFQLEWFNAPSAADYIFSGMFVRGGHWDAGSFVQPSAPGIVRTLLKDRYSTIQGMMGFSISRTNMSDEVIGDSGSSKMAIGATDNAANQNCLSYLGSGSASPTKEATLSVNDKFMKYLMSN